MITSSQNHNKDKGQSMSKMVPDMEHYSIAKKYKKMRMNGEYYGGLSSDDKQSLHTSLKPGGNSIIKTT
jgi:hypothetical protein